MQRCCNSRHVRNLLVMVLRLNESLKLAESIVSLHQHWAAHAQKQHWSLFTVYSSLFACCRQCQRWPLSVDPNIRADRCSPQTVGDLSISNYPILNTFKLCARRIWWFAVHTNTLNPLSVVNSMLTMIQSKTWMPFPNSNTFKTLQTRSLGHRHLLGRRWEHTQVSVHRRAIILLSHEMATLKVALRQTYQTIPTTRLRRMKSRNIPSVGSRRSAWRWCGETAGLVGRKPIINTPPHFSPHSQRKSRERAVLARGT